MPHTLTNSGLHEFVGERVLARYARPGVRATDLGAGPGAMAARLTKLGCEVLAVDRDTRSFEARLPHLTVDFDQPDFASRLGVASFGLVTAIVAVLTTPNVDSLPARSKFFLHGKIRTMDEHSEPTHISPVFFDLLQRQFLPRASLRLRDHLVFPPNGYQLTRKPIAWAFRLASFAFSGDALLGDNHIFVLEAAP